MNNNQLIRILISRCLLGDLCRYDGKILKHQFDTGILQNITIVPICPEVEMGLHVPRNKIRIVKYIDGDRLIQTETNIDLTSMFNKWCDKYVSTLMTIDGCILKSKSPSCGIADCKYYDSADSEIEIGRVSGFFSRKIFQMNIPQINEADFFDLEKRDLFLKLVYQRCNLRTLQS